VQHIPRDTRSSSGRVSRNWRALPIADASSSIYMLCTRILSPKRPYGGSPNCTRSRRKPAMPTQRCVSLFASRRPCRAWVTCTVGCAPNGEWPPMERDWPVPSITASNAGQRSCAMWKVASCPSTITPLRMPSGRCAWAGAIGSSWARERAGQRAAAIQSLLATASLNGLEPYAWLRSTLEKLPVWPHSRIDELLPLGSRVIDVDATPKDVIDTRIIPR